jgi:hypothetical protein
MGYRCRASTEDNMLTERAEKLGKCYTVGT